MWFTSGQAYSDLSLWPSTEMSCLSKAKPLWHSVASPEDSARKRPVAGQEGNLAASFFVAVLSMNFCARQVNKVFPEEMALFSLHAAEPAF